MQRCATRHRGLGFGLLWVALVAPAVGSSDGSVSAVQKVIQMLTDMTHRAVKDKKEEEVSFASFSTWCGNQQKTLADQIAGEKQEIETLTAEAGKLDSDIQVLGEEVQDLNAAVTKYEADIKAQTAQREKDNKDFLAEQQDYGESIDALERAIAVLQKQNYDRTALIQVVDSQTLPNKAQAMVEAFLGMMGDDEQPADPADNLAVSAPEADAYEFQSGGIIEILKKLHGEFTAKKTEVEKEEMNAQHAFDMIKQELSFSSEKAQEDIDSKTQLKLKKQQRSTEAKKEKSQTQEVLATDEKMFSDTKVECFEKTQSFKEKQILRAEEIQALNQAIKILKSKDLSGAADKHLSLAVARQSKAASLLQLDGRGKGQGASQETEEGIRRRLTEFLNERAKLLHSTKLGLIAQRMEADPFVKVKKMIQDMIKRLLSEAKDEADHKGFCDKELERNKNTRDKLTASIDGYTADVENGKAFIATLTEDISTMTKQVAELEAAMTEATELRTKEKTKNEATILDANNAMKAVEAAVDVLKEFYAKAGQATALVQISSSRGMAPQGGLGGEVAAWGDRQDVQMDSEEWNALANPNAKKVDRMHKEGMQTFGENYKGQQDEAGGVLAMLEVITSDFATLKADTESAEALSAKAYKDFMNESSTDKAVKDKKIDMNTVDRAEAEEKLRADTEDLKFAQEKMVAANKYFDKLKPTCLEHGVSYSERKQSRQDEIQSLKEALRILSGADIAF